MQKTPIDRLHLRGDYSLYKFYQQIREEMKRGSGGPSKAPKWKEDKDENESHSFHSKKSGWGFEQFTKFEELVDPPDNGWYDTKNDTVVLSAEVTAEEPTGVE
uniref:MATH domain-containing protein n=1 Tax=Globodera pallida TaxID=36090 RepID=A0A183BXH6_GLOPA